MATTEQPMENIFAFTAAGELGVNRETMLQNELLLRVRKHVMCFRGRWWWITFLYPTVYFHVMPSSDFDDLENNAQGAVAAY